MAAIARSRSPLQLGISGEAMQAPGVCPPALALSRVTIVIVGRQPRVGLEDVQPLPDGHGYLVAIHETSWKLMRDNHLCLLGVIDEDAAFVWPQIFWVWLMTCGDDAAAHRGELSEFAERCECHAEDRKNWKASRRDCLAAVQIIVVVHVQLVDAEAVLVG